jgi:hypothetical protein
MGVQEKLQVKSMFESRFITEHEKLSVKTLVSATHNKETKPVKMRYAPAPAMYWSCPQVFGIQPSKLRAHASVVYGDRMFVYGGTSKSTCSDTLYILELGNKRFWSFYTRTNSFTYTRYVDLVYSSCLW